jgi:cytochrome c553
MRNALLGFIAAFAVAVGIVASPAAQNAGAPRIAAQEDVPWAYARPPAPPPGAPARRGGGPPDRTLVTLPGSQFQIARSEINNGFNVPVWYPEDLLSMPDIVRYGRRPDVRGCGFCHLANGQGRPENSSLAGLPVSYIVQQMIDFRNGTRTSAEPRAGGPSSVMIAIAKASTPDEDRIAAEYFQATKPKQWIRVVESPTVPKTRVPGNMLVAIEPEEREPIGNRIIELPEDLHRIELRDTRTGFVAYVPPGSIKRGEVLVKTGGNGRTVACGVCHGADLRGMGPVPAIAGRSPSYLTRSLYDMQKGVRAGEWSPLMKEAVEKLTIEDMVNIVAYTSAQKP